MHLQTINIEHQTIVIDFRCDDIANCGGDSCFGGLAQTEEIEVSCRSVLLADADRKQQGAFQDELVSVFRLGQSIQEPFAGVVHERQREVFAALLRHLEQSCPHRGRDVRRRLSRHADIASQ